MKKTASAITLIAVLMFSSAFVVRFIDLTKANPYLHYEPIPPPSHVKPPAISLNGLENKTAYDSNTISLNLNVSLEPLLNYGLYITEVSYQRDWKDTIATIYKEAVGSGQFITDFSMNLTLAEIPEGSHSITFVVSSHGGVADGLTLKYFNMRTNSSAYFTVDTTSPNVMILALENRTYDNHDVLLDFAVNEPYDEASYSLDGEKNVTVAGNTTLTGLSVGVHSVKVFVWDPAGNVGASETATFSVAKPEPEPFATIPVLIIVVVSVAVAGLGLLVYFKKRGRET